MRKTYFYKGFLLVLCCFILSDNPASGDDSCTVNSETLRLHKNLFCNYDKMNRPVRNYNTTTTLRIKFVVKYIHFKDDISDLTIENWLVLAWKDEFLNWKPEEFSGIQNLHVHTSEIWMPDFYMYNSGDQSSVISNPSLDCLLSYSGTISCVIPNSHAAINTVNLQEWPYDRNRYILHFGSWIHYGEELALQLASPAISTSAMMKNQLCTLEAAEAKLLITTSGLPDLNVTFPTVSYSFVVRREVGVLVIGTIYLGFVYTIITSLAICLEPISTLRLTLLGLNIFFHINTLLNYHFYNLTGYPVPRLILFYHNSLLLTTLVLIVTIKIRTIVQNCSNPSSWQIAIINFLLKNKAGQLILLSNLDPKGAAFVSNEERNIESNDLIVLASNPIQPREWVLYGKLLDRITMIITFLIYIVLFCTQWPRPDVEVPQ